MTKENGETSSIFSTVKEAPVGYTHLMSIRTCHVQLASENSGHVISISILAVVLVYVHEFISYWVNAGSGFRHDYVFVITMWSSYHLMLG